MYKLLDVKMGFADLATSPGLILLDDFVKHKSYIDGSGTEA
jgi:hypothetical protein